MPHKPYPVLDGQQTKTVTLRLPIEMYMQILELVTKERRSIQNELLVLLDRALAPQLKEIENGE